MDSIEIVEFLTTVRLFRYFEEDHLYDLAPLFKERSLSDGEVLFSEGDPGGDFYIITSGKIHLARGDDRNRVEIGDLSRGEFFGEESYLKDRERAASAVAVGTTSLLVLKKDKLTQLLSEHPETKAELENLARSYQIARRKDFNWLVQGEVIHAVAKKHYLVLLKSLVFSAILGIAGVFILLISLINSGGNILGNLMLSIPGALLTGFAILWTVWVWIDWGNDFYVVTDKRAVWQERIVLMYESRHEAPLDAVLSVNLRTDFIQRLWGSGNVLINTYTGRIVMENVDRPEHLIDVIKEYWHRAQDKASEMEQEARVQMIRETIGIDTKEEEERVRQPLLQRTKPGALQRLFNFLKTRFEENGVVTYRKHWFLLLRRSWRVVLFLLLSTAGIVWFYYRPNSYSLMFIAFLALTNIIATFIFIYHFVDWSNDIYQVTDRQIFDIDRKPFGEDTRKSAPLERILNTSVEQNFWQRLLNYGNVIINVGEAKFTFDGVVSPSLVQQEVFQRYHTRKQKLEAEEAERERVRMVEWIKIYHEQVEGSRTVDHEPDIY